ARGLPFQENPRTGDCRISGSCASLAGLEKALNEETDREVDLAIRRILLLHGVILTIGGIPLIYLGDEIGTLNDYSFRNDRAKVKDSRWVHRPKADWTKYERRYDPNTLEGRIYAGLQNLIALRKNTPVFSGQEFQVLDTENPQVFGYLRSFQGKRAIVFANFSEQVQRLSGNLLRLYGLDFRFTELLSGTGFSTADFMLQPYQLAVFIPGEN
ncbi:MAG: alpha-glucosidase C-terminal domain-containing protein, partial [Anaerolineales bacterium]